MIFFRKYTSMVLAVFMMIGILMPVYSVQHNENQVLANASNQVTIYLKSSNTNTNTNIHYRPAGGKWTVAPGIRLLPAEVSGYQKITLSIGTASSIEACFNFAGTRWDNNKGVNYKFSTGISTYVPGSSGSPGKITPGLPYKDTNAPSAPSDLKVDTISAQSVKLSWGPSTDNMAVAGYELYRNQMRIAVLTGLTFIDQNVQANTAYQYTVRSVDMAGNSSDMSSVLSVQTPEVVNRTVTVYYKQPQGWTNTFIHYRPNQGSWSAVPGTKMETAEITGYRKITLQIGNSTTMEAVFNNGGSQWDNNRTRNYVLLPGTSRIEDGIIKIGVPNQDNTPPNIVKQPSVMAKTDTSITLNWEHTSDDRGVKAYEVYRNNILIQTTTMTTFTDTGLVPATAYAYTIIAVDDAGNRSETSASLEVTTTTTSLQTFVIYYKVPNNWNGKAFIHYRFAGGQWTSVPGIALKQVADHPAYVIFNGQSSSSALEAVFNNGADQWDNNDRKNYTVTSGTYTLANGIISAGVPTVPRVEQLRILQGLALEVEIGAQQTFDIEAKFTDGSIATVTGTAKVTVGDATIASITENGRIQAIALGSTSIDIEYLGLRTSVPVQVVATGKTKPTSTSVNSLYLSNWKDNINIWMASKLAQTDRNTIYGPRIAEMRVKEDFTVNQIRDYTSFFRNETTKADYTDVAKFNSEAYLDENGVLRTKYSDFAGGSMPVSIRKDYVTVPNQDFTVATLTFTNDTDAPIQYSMLEQLNLNNKSATAMHTATYDQASQTMYVNMTSSGQFYAALTALQPMNSIQIGEADSPLNGFRQSGKLNGNTNRTANKIALAFQDQFMIPARASVTRSFAITIEPTMELARSAISTARGQSAEYWFNRTYISYDEWLTAPGKKQLSFADQGYQLAYKRNLVMIKNSINPVSGAMPATTNPYAYGYKVWARDSAVTAMILDQAGYYEETRKYWYWLNNRMRDDGTVGTCYDLWTNRWVTFVDPEHDSIGFFLLGVYNHYKLTGDKQFLQNTWNKYKRSADFVANSALNNPYGFGAMDHSIWEEFMEYNAFTQAAYVAGLQAAQKVAMELGQPALAERYRAAELRITAAIQKSSQSGAGLWNETGQYYNRAVMGNGSSKTLVDASSAALIVYGVIDPQSTRADKHIQKIKVNLQHDGYGVARYDNDDYYFTSIYNPGGNEALSSEPAWPQMSMYVALHHIYRGEKEQALPYMKWMIERMFAGYMAQGEAVSNVLKTPVPSTSPEPVTATWYMYAALAYEGKADLRVTPLAK